MEKDINQIFKECFSRYLDEIHSINSILGYIHIETNEVEAIVGTTLGSAAGAVGAGIGGGAAAFTMGSSATMIGVAATGIGALIGGIIAGFTILGLSQSWTREETIEKTA